MSENLIIREANLNDIPVIISLIKELAQYEKLLDEVKITYDDLHRELSRENPIINILVAEYDKKIIGYSLFFHNFSTFTGKSGIYLEDLYIKPEYRNKGFGKAVLEKIISIAKEVGCGRVEWAVLDWNKSAIEFYKLRGAVPLDDWKIFRLTEDKF